MAGVLVALTVPVRARRDPASFWAVTDGALERLRSGRLTRASMIEDQEQFAALEELHEAAGDMVPPGLALEHRLHPVLAFVVLPLFALVNAGVALGGATVAAPASITTGVIAGLVVGKPLGILLLSWLTVKSGRGELPAGVTWGQVAGVGLLAGVGFTMALFIGDLAFTDPAATDRAKVGILVASALAGLAGFVVLALVTRGRRAA